MKVLQIASYPPSKMGGHQAYALRIAKGLVENGVDVELLVPGANYSITRYQGIHITQIKRNHSIFRLPITMAIPHLIKSNADIIHGHSYVFPIVVQSAIISKFTTPKFLLHLHGGLQAPSPNEDLLFKLKNRFYDPTIGRWVTHLADALASVSKTDLEFAKNHFKISKRIPLFHLPNCLELEEIDAIHLKEKKSQKILNPTIIFSGRLIWEKGVHLLPEIDRIMREEREINVQWEITGQGPFEKEIKKWSRNHPKRIRFHGVVPRNRYLRLIEKSSLLLIPSLYAEGVPTVCLEAMALGKPVVGFNSGGIVEVVRENETGYLVEPNSIELLTKRLASLLSDVNQQRRLGKAGRELVEREFSCKKVVKKTISVYERLLES